MSAVRPRAARGILYLRSDTVLPMPPAIILKLRKYLRPDGDKNVIRIRRRKRLLGVFWTNLSLLMCVLCLYKRIRASWIK